MPRLQQTIEQESSKYERLHSQLENTREAVENFLRDGLAERWQSDDSPTRPTIYGRVKPRRSIVQRIEERYRRLEDFPDLIAFRVVVLHSAEIRPAVAALRDILGLESPQGVSYVTPRGRATGYSGHYWTGLSLRDLSSTLPELAIRPAIASMSWELQIHTAMQEAWSRLSHGRFYKNRVGVPHRTNELLQRLAAVTDLVDEQFSHIENHLEKEKVRVKNRILDNDDDLVLDEYVLAEASLHRFSVFKQLRELGQAADFRPSEWDELARIGDETDLCISICERTGIRTLEELIAYAKHQCSGQHRSKNIARLTEVFRERDDASADTEQSPPKPFDRPLLVFGILRLLDYPEHISSIVLLRDSIKSQLINYVTAIRRNG